MHILANAARIVSYLMELEDVRTSASKVSQEGTLSKKMIRIADTAVKAISLGCRTACCVGRVGGASLQTLHSVKQVEKVARVCELGTTLMTVGKDSQQSADAMGFSGSFYRMVNIFERIVRPILSLGRVNAELDAYSARIALQTLENDQNSSPGHLACQREIADIYTSSAHHQAVNETLLQMNTLSFLAILHEVARSTALQHARDEQNALQVDADPADLLSLPYIPTSLHEDPIFKQHICPITKAPIRHPVLEPNTNNYYEKDDIERALASDPRSPITRLPLRKEDLIPQEELQHIIDERLRLYQTMFQDRIQSFLEVPGNHD